MKFFVQWNNSPWIPMHMVLSRQSGAGMWHIRIRCRWKNIRDLFKHVSQIYSSLVYAVVTSWRPFICHGLSTFVFYAYYDCALLILHYIVFLVTKCFGVSQIQNSVFVVMNSQTHLTSNMIWCSETWSTQCAVSLRYNWLSFISLFSDLWCVCSCGRCFTSRNNCSHGWERSVWIVIFSPVSPRSSPPLDWQALFGMIKSFSLARVQVVASIMISVVFFVSTCLQFLSMLRDSEHLFVSSASAQTRAARLDECNNCRRCCRLVSGTEWEAATLVDDLM